MTHTALAPFSPLPTLEYIHAYPLTYEILWLPTLSQPLSLDHKWIDFYWDFYHQLSTFHFQLSLIMNFHQLTIILENNSTKFNFFYFFKRMFTILHFTKHAKSSGPRLCDRHEERKGVSEIQRNATHVSNTNEQV